ncbi:MAG: hypothetical protein WC627_00515 [Legionella sp.]|jgi:hypothetical protein
MISYTALTDIAAMDFQQMRVLEAPGGTRASDEAITFFVVKLNEFFKQFQDHPTSQELTLFQQYMNQIVESINKSELQYYKSKYTAEGIEEAQAQSMAEMNQVGHFKDIPKRMQYWAASSELGGAIRNPKEHNAAQKKISEWYNMILQMPSPLFFQNENVNVNVQQQPTQYNNFDNSFS